jgi:hypothetical protein
MTTVAQLTIEMAANVARLQQDMARATHTVDGAMAKMRASADTAMRALGAIGTGAAVVGLSAWIKTAIDAADQMGKLSQSAGLAAEEVAGLQLAFQQGGAGDKFGQSMARLSKEIAGGNKQLEAMGVSTKNADGSLRSSREVLADVADKFQSYRDGVEKTAAAQQIFGKAGAEIIPVLNGGSAALDEYDQKASDLGLTLTGETLKAAEQFNDQLELVQMQAQGAARQVTTQLLPALNEMATALMLGKSSGDSLADLLGGTLKVALQTIAVLGNNLIFVLRGIAGEVLTIMRQVGALAMLDFSKFNKLGDDWKKRAQELRDAADAFDKKVMGQDLANPGRGYGFADERLLGNVKSIQEQTGAWKGVAPVLRDAAAAGAAAASAADAAAKQYADLLLKTSERIALAQQEIALGRQLTEGEKQEAKVLEMLASIKGKLSAAQIEDVKAKLKEASAIEQLVAASRAELKAAEDAAKQYQDLVLRATGRTTLAQQELDLGRQLTDAEKEHVKTLEMLAAVRDKLDPVQFKVVEMAYKEAAAKEALVAAQRAEIKAAEDAARLRQEQRQADDGASAAALRDMAASYAANIKSINDRRQVMEEDLAAQRLALSSNISLAEALELVTTARLLEKRALLLKGSPAYEDVQREIEARRQLMGVIAEKSRLDNAATALDEFKKLTEGVDAARLDSLFDGAISGAGKFITALQLVGEMQQKTAAAYAANLVQNGADTAKFGQMQADIANKSALANMAAYSTMTGALKGYAKEGGRTYKGLQTAERVFHAFELAMTLSTMAQKSGLLAAFTTTKVASDQVMADSAVTAAGTETAAAMAKGSANAVAGVANQANGDPYTAFPRMAAMAAMMAALGFVVAGAGGRASKAAPTNSGTGTVLGDATAASESLAQSLELLNSTQDTALTYSREMARSLRTIENNIAGFASMLVRTGGMERLNATVNTGTFDTDISRLMKTGSWMVGPLKGLLEGLVTKLFGQSVSISGSGIVAGAQSLADIAAQGFQGGYYTDVNTKKKALGITYSSKNSTRTSDMDGGLENQFAQIFGSVGTSIQLAADALGSDMEAVTARIKASVVNIGRVDLKGLSGTQIAEKLGNVVSAESDRIAQSVMPGLVAMQKVGEGYYQTLARAAQQTELARLTFRRLGQAVTLAGTEGALSANALINAFGGLQNYTDRTQAYFEKFYSEAERQAIQAGEFQAAMVSLGLETPRTRDEFRALVDAQAALGSSAYDTYAALLELADGFDQAVAASEELAQQTAERLVAAFTGRTGLLPALNLLAADLASTTTTTGAFSGQVHTINRLLGDAASGTLTFGERLNTATAALDPAQLAVAQLQGEVFLLSNQAGGTAVNVAGLSAALANVDTRTFVATVTSVFGLIGERVKSVLGSIASERSALREAAVSMIGAPGMSAEQIRAQIAASAVGMPNNNAILLAQERIASEQFSLAAGQNTLKTIEIANKNLARAQEEYSNAVVQLTAATAVGEFDAWASKVIYSLQEIQDAQKTLAFYGPEQQIKADLVRYQENLASATNDSKQAQLDYIASLQKYSVDASRAVTQLGRLREETVRYYDAQKALGTLMTGAADTLRASVAAIRFDQLDPQAQLASLQERFNTAYSMALSTSGETLAKYGQELNGLLNPLLQAAQAAGLTGVQYSNLLNTSLARAEATAGRLDANAPQNYQAESLGLLGTIDSTLAAIEAGALTADQQIVRAIEAGKDSTAAGLRAVVAALTGQAVPAFAAGGYHSGGLRLVGETGMELEATGPARIWNASQTAAMMRGAGAGGEGSAALVAEVRAMRQELKVAMEQTMVNTGALVRQNTRWDIDGVPVRSALAEGEVA